MIETLASLITDAGLDLPPVRAAAVPYEGASTGRRLAGWTPGSEAIDSLLFSHVDALRARSRDMIRKNAWAAEPSDEWVAQAIGTGIKPQWRMENSSARRALENLWWRWTDEADSAGTSDLYGLQALACRSAIEGGDCFTRFRPRLPKDGLSVPLQLQVLEGEHCPTNKTMETPTGTIRAGVEFDLLGRRVAYWLHPEHPGNVLLGANEPVRVPAFSQRGTPAVAHLYRVIRPGQVRGEPWLAKALLKLYNLDAFSDATLERQKLGAYLLGWLYENNADTNPLFRPSTESNLTAPDGSEFISLQPGTINRLRPGEQLEFYKPPEIGSQYAQFIEGELRWIASAAGITYEQLFNLSNANYSNIRAAFLKFRRRCEQFQFSTFVYQWCRPVLWAWLDQVYLSGAVDMPGYARDPWVYRNVDWRTPRWEWVDPLKDLAAEKLAVRCGFKSRAQVIHGMGEDPDQIDAQIAAGNASADSMGLILDSDPRKTADAGAASGQNGGNQ